MNNVGKDSEIGWDTVQARELVILPETLLFMVESVVITDGWVQGMCSKSLILLLKSSKNGFPLNLSFQKVKNQEKFKSLYYMSSFPSPP